VNYLPDLLNVSCVPDVFHGATHIYRSDLVADPSSLAISTTLDQSQACALALGLSGRVALIQGPPGTGKVCELSSWSTPLTCCSDRRPSWARC
jgi:hypothetical protein